MRKLLLAAIAIAAPALAQYQPVPSSSYPTLDGILNGKPALSTGTTIPAGNCTAAKDIYVNTASGLEYWCTASNTWSVTGVPTSLPGVTSVNGTNIPASATFAASATTDTTNAANISSGTLPAGRLPAFTGDCAASAGTGVTTCTKTGGVAFVASATTDTTSASNISSGTLNSARLPVSAVQTTQANTFGAFLQDFSAAKFKPGVSTVSALPTASANTNVVYLVTDGTSTTDCSTGGGSTGAWCRSNGTTWLALSASGSGSGTVNSGTANQLAYYAANGTAVSGLTTLLAAQFPALTGDVTTSAGSLTTTVARVAGAAPPTSAHVTGTNGSNQIVAATAGDISAITYVAGGGTANAQTVTLAPAVAALANGLRVYWLPTANNTTTTPTLAVNGLTAKTLVKTGGAALASGDLTTSAIAFAIYDGTNFELQNPQTTSGGGVSGVSGTSPIVSSGGSTPAISCATCVTSASALTSTAIMTGGGSQASQTPSSAATVDSSGNLIATSLKTGGSTAGTISLTNNATPGTVVANSWGWTAPASITTSWYGQAPNASPGANQIMLFGAPTSNVSPWAWTNFTLTGMGSTFSGPLSLSTNTVTCPTCVVASSPGIGVAHFAGSTQTVTSSTIATGDIAANAVTSAKMAVANTYRVCDIPIGDTSASSALANAQLGPQSRVCFIPAAATIVEMDVNADAGTPNIIVGRNHAGTIVNVVSAALATAASGGIACSNTGGTTGINGATTCSSTLQNTSLSAGDYLELVSGTAGGTAKLMVAHVIYTVN